MRAGFSERSDVNIRHNNRVESPHAQHQTAPASHDSLRNHTGSPSFYDELTREEEEERNGLQEATSVRSVSVRLPPKPQFQFVQDNQVLSSPLILPKKNRSFSHLTSGP